MISAMILTLIKQMFPFWMANYPVVALMECTVNHFSSRAFGIINFETPFPNFIADIMNWILNSMSD